MWRLRCVKAAVAGSNEDEVDARRQHRCGRLRRRAVTLEVANAGDRPIQVGSHYHFHETNEALKFDRAAARGFRLDIAAGTSLRFEPGIAREVRDGATIIGTRTLASPGDAAFANAVHDEGRGETVHLIAGNADAAKIASDLVESLPLQVQRNV